MLQFFYNLILVLALYAFWLSTQKYFETDIWASDKIIDRIHDSHMVNCLQNWFRNNMIIAKLFFILTTLMNDLNILYYVYVFLFKSYKKPIIILISGIVLRQMCQYINRLPIPNEMLWMNPGFPTLVMNYDVETDFFWSGHTFIAFIFGIELFMSQNYWVKFYAIFHIISELFFVLVMRAHYFMDVYAAIATYFMLVHFYEKF